MPEIEMPPMPGTRIEYADTDEHEAQVVQALITKAHQRITDRVTMVLTAVQGFASSAEGHIRAVENHAAKVEFEGVVSALITVVGMALPVPHALEKTKEALEKIADLMVQGVQHEFTAHYEQMAANVEGAQHRLQAAVEALVATTTASVSRAYNGIDANLQAAVDEGMTWVEGISLDDAWLGSMCDYMGFMQPDQHTYDTIRQSLEAEFYGVYQRVLAELGEGGDRNLNRVEHEAEQVERALYAHDGEHAWDEAYNENVPIPEDWQKY